MGISYTLQLLIVKKKYVPDSEMHADCLQIRKRGATF